jgi:hypothetical protein
MQGFDFFQVARTSPEWSRWAAERSPRLEMAVAVTAGKVAIASAPLAGRAPHSVTPATHTGTRARVSIGPMGAVRSEFEHFGRLRTSRDHSKTSHDEGVPVGRGGTQGEAAWSPEAEPPGSLGSPRFAPPMGQSKHGQESGLGRCMAGEAGAQRSRLERMIEAIHSAGAQRLSSPHSTTGHGVCAPEIPELSVSPKSHG